MLLWANPGEGGYLEPGATIFHDPGGSAWQTFDLEPNHTYGVGGFKDGDGDTVLDQADNCPAWPNADQGLPNNWSIPPDDPDCDGYSTTDENIIGTSPFGACADTATPNDEADDKWPVDLTDDQIVTGSDVLQVGSALGSTAEGGPPYDPRYDLNADGAITGSDILRFGPFYGETCA